MKEIVKNCCYGLSGLGMMWGFLWGIFMQGWLWVMAGSMIVGVITMLLDSEKD